MGQVAFDTLQASEELETAGISREQARAILLVVRKSHEVADVATKADIAEVNRNVADVRKDMEARFEKNEAQMQARFEKNEAQIQARFEKNEAQMQARFEKTEAQIADVRKDMENSFEKVEVLIADVRKDMENRFDKLGLQLTVRLGGMLILAIGVLTTILKLVH